MTNDSTTTCFRFLGPRWFFETDPCKWKDLHLKNWNTWGKKGYVKENMDTNVGFLWCINNKQKIKSVDWKMSEHSTKSHDMIKWPNFLIL